jgi:hypothetical protein
MILQLRKKPVEVDAVQWNGNNLVEVIRFMGQDVDLNSSIESDKFDDYRAIVRKQGLTIYTLEGEMKASEGDFIIKGVKGEFYPCKPDIVKATYDKVE